VDMDAIAKVLRDLMRKHINQLDQTRFARALNREFTEMAEANYFATILLVTYFSPTDHLIICNGGHPRPIWYSRRLGRWQLLDPEVPDAGPSIREAKGTYVLKPVSNLPLGVIEPTDYYQYCVRLDLGDVILAYTDALIEAKRPDGQQLGEAGLVELATQLDPDAPDRLTGDLLGRLDAWRDYREPDDDQTLIVLYHNASNPPPLGVKQALKSMSKMLGLSRV
jgi:sigma-B regulation protein RsbU (phosphoserine phosphatase)